MTRRTIKVTEANGKQMVTLVPISNIEYVQAPIKEHGDVHVRLKGDHKSQKYFFVKESIEEIEAQMNAS